MSLRADVRPVLEALHAADQPVTMFALLQRLNPRPADGDATAWRLRQVELLGCFTRAHEAGYLESLPREPGQVTETFALSARGRDLLGTDVTRPFARVAGTPRPADTPPPAVERRDGRWVLRGRTTVQIG
ncbi:hypothetical protein [Blastococcus sp. TF02A-26]|uniref:hypothetical protein n=1 Tax=Blastococcus sp. TF02A-26 TaxID=2250577 RepID=UPI000DE89454|nr:hypothetical protein [Blastococcus sp. TF02A-26]RBY86803.1 hypothetical protein DQ240_08330 [Blastococcus sp. TF02A-26]